MTVGINKRGIFIFLKATNRIMRKKQTREIVLYVRRKTSLVLQGKLFE